MADLSNMRIAIGNPHVRRSGETLMLQEILVDLDEVLMMDDASVKAAKVVLEERLRAMFLKIETQRKRIAYLETKQTPEKPRGRPRKQTK